MEDAAIHHVAAAVSFGLAAVIALGFLLDWLVRSVLSTGRRCLGFCCSCCSWEEAAWKGSRGGGQQQQQQQHIGHMGRSAYNRYDVIGTRSGEQGPRYQGRQSPTLGVDLSALDQLIARNHDLLGTRVVVEAAGHCP